MLLLIFRCTMLYVFFQTLLDLGTSANYRDNWGLTPLYNTVSNNTSPHCVELLLHDHAVIGTTDDQGWAEVHHVSRGTPPGGGGGGLTVLICQDLTFSAG